MHILETLLILLRGTTAMSLHGYLYAMVHEVLKTAILAQCIVQRRKQVRHLRPQASGCGEWGRKAVYEGGGIISEQ
jgi:hypothetical protein